jgi:hypothetical protein
MILAAVMVSTSPREPIVNRNARSGYCAQMPQAATVRPSDAACAPELDVISRMRTSATPYQDCRCPSWVKPGTLTVAGIPLAASCNCPRIRGSRPVHYHAATTNAGDRQTRPWTLAFHERCCGFQLGL